MLVVLQKNRLNIENSAKCQVMCINNSPIVLRSPVVGVKTVALLEDV